MRQKKLRCGLKRIDQTNQERKLNLKNIFGFSLENEREKPSYE